MDGVRYVLLARFQIRIDKILVDREADQVCAIEKCMTLQSVEIVGFLALHLSVQHFHALYAQFTCPLDHGFYGNFGAAKMPERITRYAEFD